MVTYTDSTSKRMRKFYVKGFPAPVKDNVYDWVTNRKDDTMNMWDACHFAAKDAANRAKALEAKEEFNLAEVMYGKAIILGKRMEKDNGKGWYAIRFSECRKISVAIFMAGLENVRLLETRRKSTMADSPSRLRSG